MATHVLQFTLQYRAGRPICRKVSKIMFWEVPLVIGRYCSNLLPRQALATNMEKHNNTLRQLGRPALYVLLRIWFKNDVLQCNNLLRLK